MGDIYDVCHDPGWNGPSGLKFGDDSDYVCKKHPKYKAIKPPKDCKKCWQIWLRAVKCA